MSTASGLASRQIARAAGVVMAAFVFSNLIGLVRQIIVLKTFGTSADMDAFNAANRVTETLFNLIAGGALASAFIPTFTGLIVKDDKKGAWQLASALANLVLLGASLTSLLAAIFAPQVVRYILAPGFAVNPAQESLTVALLRLMLPSTVLFGLSGLVIAILNSHQVFLLPALAPALYQIGIIIGVIALSPSMGIYGLAWGVVLGAGLHLGLQIPLLFRQKGKYFPTLGLHLPTLREVGRLLAPRLFGVAVVQLNFWVNTRLASQMPEGSVTGVVIAFMVMLMPQAAIAQSVAIAAMPTLSAQFARQQLAELRSSLAASLRGVLLLSIPATIALMLLRQPVVALLYQRGEFTSHSTELVAWALLWYAAGLVAHSVVEVLARAFYAMHDTKTPVIIGAIAMGINIGLSVAFSFFFTKIGWAPHGGLALANTLATSLEAIGLLYYMQRKLNGLEGRHLLAGVYQAGLASLVMGLGLYAWLTYTHALPLWQVGAGGVVMGGTVYGGVILVLGVKEARVLLASAIQRVRRILF